MDYQLTNFIVILHRATRVTRYRGARLKIERREGEREKEKRREGGSYTSKRSICEACEFVLGAKLERNASSSSQSSRCQIILSFLR